MMNIPGYQLGREVATGEYCSAYNALELDSSKTVTVKLFHQPLTSSPEFCEHLNEASSLLLNKKIGNIIPVIKAASGPEGCYLITDYFPCSTEQQPKQTRFTIGEVLNFGHQLAAGLTQLHAMGLVHGGVAPKNLIFPNPSQVTLGPGSFQRTLVNDELRSKLSISLDESCYIAPEFSTGLTARSDFFSLGVVLFELLFKVKPYIVDNPQKLQKNKENMEFSIPDPTANNLAPLFKRLLAANPEQRISTLDEYLVAVEQCGFQLEHTGPSNENTDDITPANETTNTASSTSGNKNILIFSSFAGILLIGLVYYFFIASSPVKTVDKPVANDPPPRQIKVPETVATKSPAIVNQPTSMEIADNFYLKSQQQIARNNYGSALMSINGALKEQPEHTKAIQLKKQIELEFEVRTYLSRAEKLIAEGKLTRPTNDNAYEIYTKLATLLPADDERVREGLKNIAGRYFQIASDLVLKKQFDSAKKYIKTGLSVFADDPRLKQLDIDLRKEKNKQLSQQKKIRLEKENSAKMKQQLLASQEKQRKLKAAQVKEREKVKQLQIKQQKIDLLITEAKSLLQGNQLSTQSISQALDIHQELIALSPEDSRAPQLFKQIIAAYGVLATIQKNKPNYSEALATVNLGLSLDKNDENLLQIKNEVNSLISAEQKKKKRIPVIGTF